MRSLEATNPELLAQAMAFLKAHPKALTYGDAPYARLLETMLGEPVRWRLALDAAGQVQGLLPYVDRQGPFGLVRNALPFYGSHGGPWVAPGPAGAQALEALASWWAEDMPASGVVVATLVENPLAPLGEAPDPRWGEAWDGRIGQMSPLPPEATGPAALWEAYHFKARNMVRKAEKLGVVAHLEDNDASWAFLEATHRDNIAALNGQAKGPEFFQAVRQAFPEGQGRELWVAKQGEAWVAALLVLHGGVAAEYFTPVIPVAHRDLQGLSLLIAKAMASARAKGYAWWNWGGTWASQEGVHRFKARWGTQDLPYRYFVSLRDESLLLRSPQELLSAYPYTYTLPFNRLLGAAAGPVAG